MSARSYDIVSEVLRESDDGSMPIVPDKLKILAEYCDAFDKLINEFEGERLSAFVGSDKSICLELIVPSIEITPKWDVFTQLIERSADLNIWYGGVDRVVFRFRYPSIWEQDEEKDPAVKDE